MIAPPLTIDDDIADMLVERLETVLDSATDELCVNHSGGFTD